MSETTDGIEVHFNHRRGELTLTCGSEAFARLLNAIRTEAGIADFDEIEWATVQVAVVEVYPRTNPRG